MNIEIWPLSRIVEYARSPRKNDAGLVAGVGAGDRGSPLCLHASQFTGEVLDGLPRAGFERRQRIISDKGGLSLAK
jgi:hypothetical protein